MRSIPWQELFTILAAALTWGHLLSGQCIWFHYDSPPIVQAWANKSLKHPETYGTFEDALFHSCTAQLHRVPGAPPMMAELHRQCPVTQPHVTFLLSCPSGTPHTNITSPKASRALEDHLFYGVLQRNQSFSSYWKLQKLVQTTQCIFQYK